MEISDYEQYYQKGGTYVLPIEVFNELWGEMENWKDTCKQKENIIKEAREYIEEVTSSTKGVINDFMYRKEANKHLIDLLEEDIEIYRHILEILDKENK